MAHITTSNNSRELGYLSMSALTVLNQIKDGAVFLHLQLDDVWVSEQFEILDLSFDLSHNIEAADLLSVQDLYSHFMTCQLMLSN